ncbi:MAG: glycine cleavage system aminomethyltransferase GcvT [Caulobacteraceae bacterium]|nr:glycine cleavage system aminomethyltransferase GcvT [Caulobacteraceae bacterium]
MTESLLRTPLHQAHIAAGARMVAFAGYDMPVQYRDGVLKEHLWTREHAGAFDVSHMGPAFLTLNETTGDPDADHRAVSAIVETLVCGDIAGLKPGQLRYTLLLNAEGGMVDDLMVGRPHLMARQGMLYLVVNAATKDGDFALIEAAAAGKARLTRADDRALIALQGPEAAAVLSLLIPEAGELGFMQFRRFELHGEGVVVSRSGYTGEDGFEILVPAAIAERFWTALLADDRVRPIGLGARDSLRLEAGLPLYGHDADATVSPIEANLAFAVSKKRLKAGDFPGAARIAAERAGELRRLRVGLRVLEGAPAREGAEILDARGETVGRVTSGGFAPSLSAPIAMGFVPPLMATPGAPLQVVVRGKAQPAEVVAMPFVPHRYVRNA